jgi:acetoin utilization deacetylase AcuC-like enzyme
MPLPPGTGDDIFIDAFESVLPVAKAFNPDIVAVSAGFDAHLHDLLLDLRVTVNSFYLLGRLLNEHFPNVFATLEGGYSIEELPRCLYNFVDGFNGDPMRYIENRTESDIKVWNEYEIWLNQLLGLMKKYWEI